MTSLRSPLRYPGGKAFLWKIFAQIIESNFKGDVTFCEPYAGGAGAALQLLGNGYVTGIEINDASFEIYAFWKSILSEPEEFCRRVRNAKVSMAAYNRHRAILKRANSVSLIDVGFSTFFLNRTNRSGILSGGPIGGYSQTGNWLLDARFGRDGLIKRIEDIASYSSRIKITNCDALEFIKKLEARDEIRRRNLFVYLDPPYCSNGRRLYLDYYVTRDHEALADAIQVSPLAWTMTYDDVPTIRKLYSDCRSKRLSIGHSANGSAVGKEIFILSERLSVDKLWRRVHDISGTRRLQRQAISRAA